MWDQRRVSEKVEMMKLTLLLLSTTIFFVGHLLGSTELRLLRQLLSFLLLASAEFVRSLLSTAVVGSEIRKRIRFVSRLISRGRCFESRPASTTSTEEASWWSSTSEHGLEHETTPTIRIDSLAGEGSN